MNFVDFNPNLCDWNKQELKRSAIEINFLCVGVGGRGVEAHKTNSIETILPPLHVDLQSNFVKTK